jgi:pyrophosphatase PpaX
MSLSTFLFDLDGTLIDSVELILRSYRHTMRTHRGMVPPDALWLKGVGTPIRVQLREWSEDPAEIEAMAATYTVYNLEHHDALVRPFDGIVSAVQHLKEAGKGLGLVTSKVRSGALRGLKRVGLEPCFDVIVGADDVQHPKPHPQPVLLALTQLRAQPDETVFIGDSRHDLECGRAAGVKTAAALWGPFDRAHLADLEPDFWLDQPGDILALIPNT